MNVDNEQKPIRLRLVETVTNKLDGTQSAQATVIDADTGRAIEGFVGATTQLTAQGRILLVQTQIFGHDCRERNEVVQTVESEGAPSVQ